MVPSALRLLIGCGDGPLRLWLDSCREVAGLEFCGLPVMGHTGTHGHTLPVESASKEGTPRSQCQSISQWQIQNCQSLCSGTVLVPNRSCQGRCVSCSAILVICLSCRDAITELIYMCSTSTDQNPLRRCGSPIPQNQQLLFDQDVHQVVMDVVKCPFELPSNASVCTAFRMEWQWCRGTVM